VPLPTVRLDVAGSGDSRIDRRINDGQHYCPASLILLAARWTDAGVGARARLDPAACRLVRGLQRFLRSSI
jgi:hypothetical protein